MSNENQSDRRAAPSIKITDTVSVEENQPAAAAPESWPIGVVAVGFEDVDD